MMGRREELEGLLRRVETASGPDIEIDALIYAAFDDRDVRYADGMMLAKSRRPPRDECVMGFVDPGKTHRHFSWEGAFLGGVRGSAGTRPDVTYSMDAALALVERKLPGCVSEIRYWPHLVGGETPDNRNAYVTLMQLDRDGYGDSRTRVKGVGTTVPLAILAALLAALIAQTETVAA